MIEPFGAVLALSIILFFMGAFCTVVRSNLLMILIGVEIMLNSAGLALVAAALRWQTLDGQALVIFVMAIAAAEVSVGLALIVSLQKRTGTALADRYSEMKG